MHLTLYPANLTEAQFDAGAAALCALPYAIQPRVSQSINGDWSLSFQYPLSGSTGADLLALDMLVLADGQLYRIEDRERGSGRDSERCTVRAVHLMYDLRNRAIENIETAELTPGGVNQEIALEQVLNGSAFSAGTVDTDIVLDYLDILQKDVVWAIKEQILPQWGGELLPDNWTINILKQMGADRGVHLRHGKNIKGVRYAESLDGVVTRLHILGYQNANIESINDGKDYIDSANIGLWSNPREDYVTFPDDDLPEDLLSKGTAYLATVDTPRITLSVDLAQVRTSAQYAHYKDLERVELGDTVTVYHSRLGINITARVQSREFDPVTGENYRVELGNDNRNLYSSIANLQQAADITRMIADRNGHVRGERLRGVIDLLTSRLFASGSYVNAVVNDETGILFENTNIESVDYGAMFIGPGIFAIANEKDGTGQWIWRTFGTAGGFYGDELVAGSVTANKLASDVGQSLDISSNMSITLKADKITTDGINSRLEAAELLITPTAITSTVRSSTEYVSDLAGKAGTGVTDALNTRLGEAESVITSQGTSISQNSSEIALKADKTTTDGLSTRLDTAESIITPTAIVNTVRSSTAYAGDLAEKANASELSSYSTITQTAEDIMLAVTGVQVGGTNIVPDSIINTISSAYGFSDRVVLLENSTTYTMSVRAKRNSPSAKLLTHIINGSYNWSCSLFTETDDFSVQTLTFTTASNVEDYDSVLYFYSYPGGNGGSVAVDWVKIEKGNKATDWSPAPADPASGIKTSYIEIRNNLLKLLTGGRLELLSGSIFKLLSGSGTNHISLDNSREDGCFLFFGGETPETAPAAFWRDGTIKNVANSYTQTVTENADGTHGVIMDVFFPDDVSLVDKVLLSIKMAPFRAYSTGAAQSAVLTSDAGGGAEKTSRSGGGVSSTTNQNVGNTGEMTAVTNTRAASVSNTGDMTDVTNTRAASVGNTGDMTAPTNTHGASVGNTGDMTAVTNTHGPSDDATGASSAANTGLGGSHSHSVAAISDNAPTSDPGGHTHTGPSHLHTIESHTHTGPNHSHTGPEHVHTGNSHSHAWSDTSGGPSANYTNTVDGTTYDHSHTLSSHTHYVSGTTGAAGTGNTGAAGTGATGTAGTGATGGTALSTNNAGTGNTGSGGSHTHTFTVKAHDTGAAADHNHGMAHTHSLGAHTHQMGAHWHSMAHTHQMGAHWHSMAHTHEMGSHWHNMEHVHEMGAHWHNMEHTHDFSIGSHTHIVDIDAHTHTVPAHAHDIVYGIYEGTTPVTVDVYVDGVLQLDNKTVVINENIAAFFSQTNNKITRNMFHTIEIRPNTLGRISAFLYIKTTQISKVAGTL